MEVILADDYGFCYGVKRAIKTALQMLEAKECICMFPEGTRSKDGKLHKGAPGVELIAAK